MKQIRPNSQPAQVFLDFGQAAPETGSCMLHKFVPSPNLPLSPIFLAKNIINIQSLYTRDPVIVVSH